MSIPVCITLVAGLTIIGIVICCLSKSGANHIDFEGKFGPASARFSVDRIGIFQRNERHLSQGISTVSTKEGGD